MLTITQCRTLTDLVGFCWPVAVTLANGAFSFLHPVKREIENPAHENEDKPVELFLRDYVSFAQVAVHWGCHISPLLYLTTDPFIYH